jgi:hypothetical protein
MSAPHTIMINPGLHMKRIRLEFYRPGGDRAAAGQIALPVGSMEARWEA